MPIWRHNVDREQIYLQAIQQVHSIYIVDFFYFTNTKSILVILGIAKTSIIINTHHNPYLLDVSSIHPPVMEINWNNKEGITLEG